MASSTPKNSVLFVCLGNICRSPIAEGVFSHLLEGKGLKGEWLVDSCATMDYHTGKTPDHRALKVMKEKGIPYDNRAREIRKEDFRKFKYILAMDDDNVSDLKVSSPKDSTALIKRLGEFDPKGELNVRDPYYDRGDDGFYTCHDHCLRACEAFLEAIQQGKI